MLQADHDHGAGSKGAKPKSKGDLLLRFKTITSMLSALQSSVRVDRLGVRFYGSQATESHLDMCTTQDLAILTALATVLVRDDEVVAAITKNRVLGGPLEILVMHHAPSDSLSKDAAPGIEIITPVASAVGKGDSLLTDIPE